MKASEMEALCRPIVVLSFEPCGCRILYSALGATQKGSRGPQDVGCRIPNTLELAHRVPKVEFIERLAEQEGYTVSGDLDTLRLTLFSS